MVNDAEKYKLDDQELKKKADAYNALEDCLYDMKNKMKDYNIKKRVNPETLEEIEKGIAKATKRLNDHQAASLAELHLMKTFSRRKKKEVERRRRRKNLGSLTLTLTSSPFKLFSPIHTTNPLNSIHSNKP
ncbi:hypothetical protein QVD17_02942 [Tagetes erecta]|uniref:Uncharacterized protein n=1 Tax=Tagetes erecta TaxID=13708 RepID=A0AAD8LDP7_TARER|nr:hypothetical protein QVD17_02942 [Tagetes erecta]